MASSSHQRRPPLQTGDLVFQTTRGRLAAVIHAATLSKFTHVGFVVMRKGKARVLEANGPVRMTRLDRFIRRGVGRRVVIKRVRGGLSRTQKRRLVRAGRRHLGVRYDPGFRWSDRRMYCSELVWKAYRRGIGLTLAKPQTMADLYSPYNPIVRVFARRTYGKRLPLKERIVSPKRLFDSAKLETIYDDTWF
jgi:uncharacterized protein YycO